MLETQSTPVNILNGPRRPGLVATEARGKGGCQSDTASGEAREL
jgi:hypothetical protein